MQMKDNFISKSKLHTSFLFRVLPVQLTFVMIGGLGLSVSVVTWIVSVITPSLLGVNPSTDSEYWVAGSSNRKYNQDFSHFNYKRHQN